MNKKIKVLLIVSIAVLAIGFLFVHVVKASGVSPETDLAEALVYWQEQAVKLAQENAVLKAENERLAIENKNLRLTLNDAELLIVSLRADLNDMAIKVEQMNSLRLQAENALSLANITIKQLEDTIKKLTGVKYGLVLGGTYSNGSFGGMAGVTTNF